MSIEDRLFTPAAIIGITGTSVHLAKGYNRDLLPSLTHHIGDFSLVFMPILVSGITGGIMERIGERYDVRVLKTFGKYLPILSASSLSIYFSLSECIQGFMPGNTSDVRDIPAVVLAASSGYVLAKYFQKEVNGKK